ncbi:energy-coupling factor ABC transporter permease (plasmid) [Haloferax mediterranei ATCC 33500]|uniref:Putative cobalt transport protein CbiM n=1 Tax=Haloferax mediterranei (strain ATCC 33500 / DSM 1411 / JCM 8866 / NBRC 14739 / NCIMB 2177 / R-4) TaxID=523841 RepID=I3R9J4_HALMT|nr:energy-coupling factor ABC transporter permease [Haloferax mediterranei]AFK20904.2 cobalt transport protein CbiM [Haloferax mediterranei ATCC 33500]AHZ24227.1 cobalamin biosynthesis protein CbiM [Haloferax mediterranei ATCC 33500]EMA05306.1 cobalt transport protein CbiM [Haloferax mediterranei ATCC 33500]MDX5989892.1 energy-coupling factor ABC transporter permease [Haloferax mediterranei ATCC 33500]QCQ77333.1 energy-coupling factor ABC transporter permease [Haloferax mediterranei ATCC 33500
MHIMEGFLPPFWAIVWTVVALPIVAYGAKRTLTAVKTDTRTKALIAIGTAFVFVLSALKLPSVVGSSSHPTGTGVMVVLFGPAVTAFAATIVLLYQSLLLAHGGLTTLGANVTAMGIVGPFVGWAAYRLVRPHLSLEQATFVAAVLTDWVTYLTTSVQLGLAFPGGEGIAGVVSSTVDFAAVFAITQLPIGIFEGLIAAALVGYLVRVGSITKDRLGVTA